MLRIVALHQMGIQDKLPDGIFQIFHVRSADKAFDFNGNLLGASFGSQKALRAEVHEQIFSRRSRSRRGSCVMVQPSLTKAFLTAA